MNQDGTSFGSFFSRRRDFLMVAGDPGPLCREMDLHLLSCEIDLEPPVRRILHDGLVAMALYLVSRPRFDSFGWTINLQEPRVNLFYTGSQARNTVVGRVFLDNVVSAPENLFYAQTRRPHGPLQTSSLEVKGNDAFAIVEQYCGKSDQQSVRFFRNFTPGNGKVALLMAFPEASQEWFWNLTGPEILELEQSGELELVAERAVYFRCGCDSDWITQVLVNFYRDDPEDLFQGDPAVEAECPRCGGKHVIYRHRFEDWLAVEEE